MSVEVQQHPVRIAIGSTRFALWSQEFHRRRDEKRSAGKVVEPIEHDFAVASLAVLVFGLFALVAMAWTGRAASWSVTGAMFFGSLAAAATPMLMLAMMRKVAVAVPAEMAGEFVAARDAITRLRTVDAHSAHLFQSSLAALVADAVVAEGIDGDKYPAVARRVLAHASGPGRDAYLASATFDVLSKVRAIVMASHMAYRKAIAADATVSKAVDAVATSLRSRSTVGV